MGGGTASTGRGGRRGGINGINVTPMVDIMLVLLVIMMVAALQIAARAIKVELPKSASSDEGSQSPLTVTVTKDRQYYVNNVLVPTEAELVATFQKATAGGNTPNLVLSADKEALHGNVVHVIDLAKQQGIVKFAINVTE
jgi:biopolymer transport protein ExbD